MPDDLPISVVITAYNSERFVADAIHTARNQSVPPREIIVVDDGSTDRTAEIAIGLGAFVLTQRNAGSAAARNTGTRAAGAPWVAYLDVDDLWAPEKLLAQMDALQASNGAGFSFCEYAEFNDAGIIAPNYLASCPEFAGVILQRHNSSTAFADRESLSRQLLLADFIAMSSLVVRRDLALHIGGFDETLRRNEDYDFLLRLLKVTDAAIVERRTAFYRVHASSKSSAWHSGFLAKNTIGERIAEHPDRYPAGAARHFASQRVANINAAAKNLLRNQRYLEARDTAVKGLAERRSWSGFATVLLSRALRPWPAAALHSMLRALKRRRAKSPPRTLQAASAFDDLSRALPS